MNEEERILGIDYGTKNIGIAVSDPLGLFASPLETVKRGKLEKRIEELILVYPIKKIIIGYPLRTDGKVGKRAEEVEEFAAAVRGKFNIEVELWDERYSTVEAERIMKDAGKSPSREKPKVDRIAAAVILQSYLDEKRGNKPNK